MKKIAEQWTIHTLLNTAIGTRRYWAKRKEPMKCNIIVNDMKEVLRHKDKPLPTAMNYGTLQSVSNGSWHINLF